MVTTGCVAEDVSGSLHARGTEIGDWDLFPEMCHSGEPDGFLGVDLATEDWEHHVRHVQDPAKGATIVAFTPQSGRRHLFYPEDCERFLVKLVRTDDSVDEIDLLNGYVDIDCATESGTLHGKIEYEGCH